MPPPTLALTPGDPSGIGPEVLFRALLGAVEAHGEALFAVFGHEAACRAAAERFAPELLRHPRVRLVPVPPQAGPAHDALAALEAAGRDCLDGGLAALVTGPVSKEAILRSGVKFTGQTEFLADLAGTRDVIMMLLGPDDRGRWLRVALATTHVPLRRVADVLEPAVITRAILHAADACRRLGLARRRVGVCGLNPHAGEGGLLGDEEVRVITPAIAAAREAGAEVAGPLAADTLFHRALRGDFDAVVAMYHDQGLAPLKMIAFDQGVNWTLGLPFPRTSPDHGTAFDIAGRGVANPASMRAAIDLAVKLAAA
ncbi:MAG: 4-hydroxythreonine-4-phosphate dehydrogenase PdxA [Limisphaerales bacterium]